jgi:hypothetical protein
MRQVSPTSASTSSGSKKPRATTAVAFVDASLQQLIAAARLPNGGISQIAVNAGLALIE